MSLQEQNRMLQIFHRKGISRKNIIVIMEDLKKSGIFDDPDVDKDDEKWEIIDRKADVWFSDLSPTEKLKAVYSINVDHKTQLNQLREQNLFIIEQRIQKKMKEMEELGLTGFRGRDNEDKSQFTARYGRTPLHEAIAMRNLDLVKKYVKKGLYLTHLDNNGHTPMEMAHYKGYKEAIKIFTIQQKKK